jgi:hypothetical protein
LREILIKRTKTPITNRPPINCLAKSDRPGLVLALAILRGALTGVLAGLVGAILVSHFSHPIVDSRTVKAPSKSTRTGSASKTLNEANRAITRPAGPFEAKLRPGVNHRQMTHFGGPVVLEVASNLIKFSILFFT